MPPAPQTPRKATLSSRLSTELRGQILHGTLAPGEKINLDRLRAEHGLSISPLREAMARLVADGLVRFEDQRGYTVAPISRADLAEITALRVALETMALARAVAQGDLDWESTVMGALYRLSKANRAAIDEWEGAHSAFHIALVSGCGQPRLMAMIATLRGLQDRYRLLFPEGAQGESAAEHAAIAEAVTARESARSTVLLSAHIEATAAGLHAAMAARGVG